MSLSSRCSRPLVRSTINRSSVRFFAQSTNQSNKDFIAQNAAKFKQPQPGDQMHNNPKNRFKQPINQTAEQTAEELERLRKTKYKNLALGGILMIFVVWSYQNSIQTVRHAADAINASNLDNIEQELDDEQIYAVNKK